MRVFARYGQVLRGRGARSALLASVVGRLSLGMTGLALLILVRAARGSYADAGAVAAAYAVAFAVGAPARARAADRRGPVGVLRITGVAHPLAFVGMVVLADEGAPTVALLAAAVLMGITVPPLGAVMRALWGRLVDDADLPSAYSLESVVVETCFVLGPLLVAAIADASREAALLTSAALGSCGAWALAGNAVVRTVTPHPGRSSSRAGPLGSAVVRACLVNVLWMGVGFGAIEVGVLAFVEEHGRPRAVAGVVLAVWSLGSMVGGLVYGGLRPTSTALRQLPVLVTLVGLAACLPVLAPGVTVLAVLLVLSGSTIAPFSACNSLVIGAAAPAGTVTEAFAWNSSMIFGGAAVGNALAGVLVDAGGARSALAVTAVSGALMVGTCLVGVRMASSRSAAPAAP